MFVVLALYRMDLKHQSQFCKESRSFYEVKMKRAKGFVRLLFLRNLVDREFVDVLTEWTSKSAFMRFLRSHPQQPSFSVPHEVLERYLFETLY